MQTSFLAAATLILVMVVAAVATCPKCASGQECCGANTTQPLCINSSEICCEWTGVMHPSFATGCTEGAVCCGDDSGPGCCPGGSTCCAPDVTPSSSPYQCCGEGTKCLLPWSSGDSSFPICCGESQDACAGTFYAMCYNSSQKCCSWGETYSFVAACSQDAVCCGGGGGDPSGYAGCCPPNSTCCTSSMFGPPPWDGSKCCLADQKCHGAGTLYPLCCDEQEIPCFTANPPYCCAKGQTCTNEYHVCGISPCGCDAEEVCCKSGQHSWCCANTQTCGATPDTCTEE
jgi:hypothetical protein